MTATMAKTSPKLTPMLAQYQSIKEQYPGCLLFFRLGDFYELFFEDAIVTAKALDITLTKRGKNQGEEIPMCGVPFHAAESYIARLIRQGHKVAICEQLEDPATAKKRGGHKAVVKRDVIRVITSGTLTEDSLLDAKQHNFLLALASHKESLGLALIDISTGDFFVESLKENQIQETLLKYTPSEILLSQSLSQQHNIYRQFQDWKRALTIQPDVRFDIKNGEQRLKALFKTQTLEIFGRFNQAELAAASGIISYIDLTQKGHTPPLKPPRHLVQKTFLQIDAATRKNLEILSTLSGEKHGSLRHAIDHTLTAGGARLFLQRLAAPLADAAAINARLDQVSYFKEKETTPIKETLKQLPDLERLLGRISLNRAGPRDLLALGQVLERTKILQDHETLQPNDIIRPIIQNLDPHQALWETISQAIKEDPPLLAREGNFIAQGYHQELDHLRSLRDDGKQSIAALQTKYIQETGINALKIKHNNILGYFIEITAMHKDRVPETFIHRQTLANNMRFTTLELTELEQELASAAEKALAIELKLFDELIISIHQTIPSLLRLAESLNHLDVTIALATLAEEQNYCRPRIDTSDAFQIIEGRHPVVEKTLQQNNETFTGNDCTLEKVQKLWLITGPNMAGKSTFLRQNALIVIMAQMGSFVPATSAHIGIVDGIFSRVGASDNIAEGHSTFMVEMIETATILHQATARSFVIMDEIGRGTATYDGVSLAWSVVEYLHNQIKCRGLFATHYHELTSLKDTLSCLKCYTMRIKEWEGEVIFLHKMIEGIADKSYGIHVAELAGLPRDVIHRATELLSFLEKNNQKTRALPVADLPLFHNTPVQKQAPKAEPRAESSKEIDSPLQQKLNKIDPDALTPRQALEIVYELKTLLKKHCANR